MSLCCIGLGGNTGNPKSSFDSALARLGDFSVSVIEISPSVVTPAMGASAGPPFLNAAAVLDTDLTAQELLKLLHRIEAELGRERLIHWGPRPIDLDLLFFEQEVIDTEILTVPHPALWYRHFVLTPLSQVAPDWIHPVLGESVLQLLHRLQCRPLKLEVLTDDQRDLNDLKNPAAEECEAGLLEFLPVTSAESALYEDSFARLVETRASAAEQPAERRRIIRVPVDRDRTTAADDWKDFLEVFRAALGI